MWSSRSYLCLTLLPASIIVISVAAASPDLGSRFTVDGAQLFADHTKPNTYYFVAGELELITNDGRPSFKYDLNRYIGRRLTADREEFRVRGVLKFAVRPHMSAAKYREIKRALARRNGRDIELLPAPQRGFSSRLVYALASDASAPSDEQTIEGGASRQHDDEDAGPLGWSRRQFTVALLGNDAELFWNGFKNDRLTLSLAYAWTVNGVIETDDADGGWRETTQEIANSLPIEVSMREHPEAFARPEIWQQMSMAHTNLTVACYDFVNALVTDLYYVAVEVKFRTLRDQDYVERVRFTEGDDRFEQIINFKLAKDLGAGYQYRVERLFADGRKEVTDWLAHDAQTLDVTLYEDDIDNEEPS